MRCAFHPECIQGGSQLIANGLGEALYQKKQIFGMTIPISEKSPTIARSHFRQKSLIFNYLDLSKARLAAIGLLSHKSNPPPGDEYFLFIETTLLSAEALDIGSTAWLDGAFKHLKRSSRVPGETPGNATS